MSDQLEQFKRIFEFKHTWAFQQFLRLPHSTIGFFTGNRALKTASVAYHYVLRILGWHPIPQKNVLYFECPNYEEHKWVVYKLADGSKIRVCKLGQFMDSFAYPKGFVPPGIVRRPKDNKCPVCGEKVVVKKRASRIIRIASENLPTDKETVGDGGQSTEIKCATYPEFKKWLPPFLIKKDITMRQPAMTIHDPNAGIKFGDIEYRGADIVAEFVSYSQQVLSTAGVDRFSVWMDEHAPFDFYEEQIPRLISDKGDLIVTLTPAMGGSWEYDGIFENASVYVRTDAMCEFLSTPRKKVNNIEFTDSEHDIAIIQAATDDNPTLDLDVIDKMYRDMIDPDGTVVNTRRYGVFKESTGRIFKDFNFKIHVINPRQYLIDDDVLSDWVLGRTQDFHTANPHAILWVAMSPTNEVFIYKEWSPSPDKWVTVDICRKMCELSGKHKFICNLIDPLANTKNPDTGKTTIETMNGEFFRLKKEGKCGGGYWEPYFTKGEVGRDEIKMRLQNALKAKVPFNNKEGNKYFPTMWVFNECRETARSLKHWRRETWANNRQLTTKDKKEQPAQKFSHFCTALEGLLKDKRFRPRRVRTNYRETPQYFKGAA